MTGKFIRIKCIKCENEQIIFNRTPSVISCSSCNEPLTQPTGGIAIIHGEIIETLSNQ